MKAFNFSFSRTIGFKLFVLFLISILLAASLVGIVSYQIAKNSLESKVGNNMQQVTQDATANMDLWLAQFESIFNQSALYFMHNKFLLRDQTQMTPEEITAANNSMKQYLSSVTLANPMIQSFSIVRFTEDNHSGTKFSERARTEVFQSDWVKEAIAAKERNIWLSPQSSSFVFETERETFALAKSYFTPEALQYGEVLIMEFNVKYVADMLKAKTFGDIGDVTLIGGNGSTYYSNSGQFAFGSSAPMGWSEQAASPEYWTSPEEITYLMTRQVSEKLGWNLVGRIPLDVLLVDANQIYNTVLLSILFALLLAIGLGIWSYFMIGRPLILAKDKMKQAEDGDLHVRLKFKRNDEIGNVGTSFDNMLERIHNVVEQTTSSIQRLRLSTDQLNQLASQSSGASKEISVTMEEVAQGASNLAKDAENGNSLTIQLFEKLNDMLEKNKTMESISGHVEQESNKGAAAMEGLQAQNQQVNQIVAQLHERIQQLSQHAGSISEVLTILNTISKQINILSLNASIVAAQSGEAGKAFMVVAHEIRNLANQSNQSIDSVSRVVQQIQEDMHSTSQLVQNSMPIFAEQMKAASDSQLTFQSVEQAMQEFRDSFKLVWESLQQSIEVQKELSENMMQVSAISQESSAATENVASLSTSQYQSSESLVQVATELEQMSEQLTQALKVFKL